VTPVPVYLALHPFWWIALGALGVFAVLLFIVGPPLCWLNDWLERDIARREAQRAAEIARPLPPARPLSKPLPLAGERTGNWFAIGVGGLVGCAVVGIACALLA